MFSVHSRTRDIEHNAHEAQKVEVEKLKVKN